MNRSNRFNWRLLLTPFSWLFGLGVWTRNALCDSGLLHSTGFNLPIISVGNITVGGTGKTPHVEYLAELLKEDCNVATLSRGYKRSSRDFRMASADSSAREIGDEPLQIKQRFSDITVAVDRKRVNGVKKLMNLDPPVDVILLDDAFQHRSIKPGFSILLIDHSQPLDADRLLPAGNLRESPRHRKRANIIIVTRCPERMKPIERREIVNKMGPSIGQHLFFTTIRYGELVQVFPDALNRDKNWFKENIGGVLIVTGIANPRPIRQYARGINTNIREITFPDHHRYRVKDLERIKTTFSELKNQWEQVLILTTEKDAMRLREHKVNDELRDAFRAVRIHIHFLNDDKDNFDQQIRNYVNSNKRSSILYQGAD